MNTKKTRGRGRPQGITRIHYNCRLPRDIVAWLRSRKNGGRLIEQALRNYYNFPDKEKGVRMIRSIRDVNPLDIKVGDRLLCDYLDDAPATVTYREMVPGDLKIYGQFDGENYSLMLEHFSFNEV